MNAETPSPREDRKSIVKHDFLASIVVFLVALPLCMGISIASGVPVAAGLITGIVGGLVVGAIAGCPLQVSGPAAGLTIIVYEVVQQLGLEMLGLVVLMAGLMQVAAGLLRLGQWFRAVSPAVIKGMLAGIGFLILGSQFHVMIDDTPKGSGAENLATIPAAIFKSLAMPEFASPEVRKFHTRALRDVGELRRRQIDIRERLRESVPRNEAGQLSDDPTYVIPTDLRLDLENRQRAVSQDLTKLVEELEQFEGRVGLADDAQRILDAATSAKDDNEAALTALQQKPLTAIDESQAAAVTSLEDLSANLKNHHLAAYLGVLTIVLIILWQSATPKFLRVVPAPLVAVVVATVVASVLVVPVLYVEVPVNLLGEIHLHALTVLDQAPWGMLWKPAILMAIVASAETLLCATAVDQMQQGPRTRYDRELFAQGVGNSICGMLGALPMTGVIVRSSANVQSGGRTRLSTILHGFWLLIFVAALAFLLRMIPTACLAAMLVYTGYKLIDLKSLKQLRAYGWGEVGIYVATVATIVFTDLLSGVLVGIGLSAVKLLYTFSHLAVKLHVNDERRQATLSLHGAATFIRLPQLASCLEGVPAAAELHVDFEHLDYIDHACLDLLMNWAKQHQTTGGKLVIDWESLHARFSRESVPTDSNANLASPPPEKPPAPSAG